MLADLAGKFGVSRERVRQIEVRAFEKIQKTLKERVAATEASAYRRKTTMVGGLPSPVSGIASQCADN